MKRKIRITESELVNTVTKMLYEYIGDMGQLGRQDVEDFEDDPFEGFNSQPINHLTDDTHDAMGVGDEDIDPTYYDDPDWYTHEDNHTPSDNELYHFI